MNANEAARLAAAINLLRPEWPCASLRTFILDKLAHRPYRDAAVALAWVACEPEPKTPARVLEPGPWWKVGVEDERRPAATRCGLCATIHTPQSPCASRPSQRRASYLAEMRELARNAKRPPDRTVERARKHAVTVELPSEERA